MEDLLQTMLELVATMASVARRFGHAMRLSPTILTCETVRMVVLFLAKQSDPLALAWTAGKVWRPILPKAQPMDARMPWPILDLEGMEDDECVTFWAGNHAGAARALDTPNRVRVQ